jgi:hypothetical protein
MSKEFYQEAMAESLVSYLSDCTNCEGQGGRYEADGTARGKWVKCPKCGVPKKHTSISGLWLHAAFNEHGEPTDKIRVCIEVNGAWREVVAESCIGHVSTIVEPAGMERGTPVSVPGQPITEEPK